jgi:L-iditol 2-dehydrogenase
MLVKMGACGICGTDIIEWYRKPKAPRILGHEMAGEVVALGKGVSGFKIGDRVFASHHVACQECRYCRSGRSSACEVLHKGNYDPGGFAEYIRIPEVNVKFGTFVLPSNVHYLAATMIEPLACVIAGQKRITSKVGHTALVIGAGVSGLAHIQLAKQKGFKVIATDLNQYRLNKATDFGADFVINAKTYSPKWLRGINNGYLADIVIVCAGSIEATLDALSSVDRRGEILFFAVSAKPIELPSVQFWRSEIAVQFSYGATNTELREALDLITHNKFNAQSLVSHAIPIINIQEGFRLVEEAAESLKVVVVPDYAR